MNATQDPYNQAHSCVANTGATRLFALLATLLFSLPGPAAWAATSNSTTEHYASVEQASLDPGWLALLHYAPSRFATGWTSEADSPEFFLSRSRQPRDELIAAVAALQANTGNDDDFRCKFPARYVWIQRNLGLESARDVLARCNALAEWFAPLPSANMAISFASAYLENPSSVFGHTFLRAYHDADAGLLTPTLNYAADAAERGGTVNFIVRGLLGGFPGVVDQLPLFRRLRTYSDDEGRDVWEYPLQLSAAQIQLLLLHIWEIKDGRFDYYFLGENCSYRTLAMIAAVRPDLDLLSTRRGSNVPIDTLRTLHDAQLLGPPRLWPAGTDRLHALVLGFSRSEIRQVIRLGTGKLTPDEISPAATLSDQITGLSNPRRARMLAAASAYLDIQINRDLSDRSTRNTTMHGLINARLAQSGDSAQGFETTSESGPIANSAKPSPLAQHLGGNLGLEWIHEGGDHGAALGLAGFGHQRSDSVAGFARGAEISILGLRYKWLESTGGKLDRFTVLSVRSRAPTSPLLRCTSWDVYVGRRRKYLESAEVTVDTIRYAQGRTWQAGPGVFSALVGADLDSAGALDDNLGVEANVLIEWSRQSVGANWHLRYRRGAYVAGDDRERESLGASVGIPLGPDLSLQLSVGRVGITRHENRFGLELRWYVPVLL